MTIYSPKRIGGLNTLCFKIRGLFETETQLRRRAEKIKSLFPMDNIYLFEVGKWCAFSENDSIESTTLLKQLNYSMKCYLENIDQEKIDFEKRKEQLQSQTTPTSHNLPPKKNKKKNLPASTPPISSSDDNDQKGINAILDYLQNSHNESEQNLI